MVQTEKSGTLGTVNDQTLFVCYVLCSEGSNSMKSSNPHSGTYETEVAPTVDTTDQSPAKGQGGLAVIAIAGNIENRKPENGGNGNGFRTDGKSYTLTATDRPGVCYENHAQDARYDEKGTCPTITSRFGTGGGNVPLTFGKVSRAQEVMVKASQVRRLTVIECERLQGFPDNYTQIPYRGKPAESCPDAPRYKAIGNSWAVPVVQWLGKRIDAYLEGKL